MQRDSMIATARALFDAFTTHDLSIWERALHPEFRADYPCAPGLGLAAARAYNAPFLAAFPDLSMRPERIFVDGTTVVLDGIAAGTFTQSLARPDAVIPPNGNSGSVRIVLIVELRDGKIYREQTVWNQLDLFTQLGLLAA